MDIAQFKAQNPDYKDVPDLQLADALHQKYYSDVPRDKFLKQVGVAGPGGNFAPSMNRDDYAKQFIANNPQANQDTLAAVLDQYDQQATARAKAPAPSDQPQTADQLFNARLNERLQGKQNGVVPQLPGKIQPDQLQNLSHHNASTFDKTAGNFVGGALNTLVGAGAAGLRLIGDDSDAAEWDAGRQQIAARQKELGGDTFTGKVASLVGGIVPALAVPEDMVSQYIGNAGLFAIPAFQDTLKAKLADGYSKPLALAHAAEAFGINLFAPTVMQKGTGALLGKVSNGGAAGIAGAARGLTQAAGEGAGFSVLNSTLDKGTDLIAGQKNDRAWIDPEDAAVQMAGFGAMRAGHIAAHAGAAALGHAQDAARQHALVDQIAKAPSVDDAITAATAAVSATRASDDVASILQQIRPLATKPATWADAMAPAADGAQAELGQKYVRVTNPDGSTGFAPDVSPTMGEAGNETLPAEGSIGRAGGGVAGEPGAPVGERPAPTGPVHERAPALDALPGEQNQHDPVLAGEGDHGQPALTGDDNWHTFPLETGTLGIPRDQMPQVKSEHRGALTNYLNARGISHEHVELPAESLKPTQAEFWMDKVQQAHDYQGGDRSILVSSDGHVMDGHHQWLAAVEKGEPVKAIRLNAPIRDLLGQVKEFPSAGTSEGAPAAAAAPAPAAAPEPAKAPTPLEVARAKHARQEEAVRLAAQNIAARKAAGEQPTRDTRGTGVRFHGTSREMPGDRPNNEYAMSGDNRNIYGQGFYTTDAADISEGYMRKGKGKSPTLYEIKERGAPKLYDMEQPLAPEVRKMAERAMGDAFPEEDIDGKPIDTLRGLLDEYRAESQNNGLTRDEVQETFDAIRYNLEQQGYHGYRHIGGAKTGKPAHDVRIYWAPEDHVDVQKSDIDKYKGEPEPVKPAAEPAGDPDVGPVTVKDGAGESEKVAEGPTAPLAEGIPRGFLKKTQLDRQVYNDAEKRWETVSMPADRALASVRDDISNLEALMRCMKG